MMGYHARARQKEQREASRRKVIKQTEAMAQDDLMRAYEMAYMSANGYHARVLYKDGWYLVHTQANKLPTRHRRAELERRLGGLQARASLRQAASSMEHPEYLDED